MIITINNMENYEGRVVKTDKNGDEFFETPKPTEGEIRAAKDAEWEEIKKRQAENPKIFNGKYLGKHSEKYPEEL